MSFKTFKPEVISKNFYLMFIFIQVYGSGFGLTHMF